MKRILAFLIALMISVSYNIQVLAISNSQTNTTEQVYSKSFDIVPMDKKSFIGNSGHVRLEYLSGGYLSWEVSLNATAIASFSGNLRINKLGTPFGTKNISIFGTYGTEDIAFLDSGRYEVEITGSSIGVDGKVYRVVPNATLPFTVK